MTHRGLRIDLQNVPRGDGHRFALKHFLAAWRTEIDVAQALSLGPLQCHDQIAMSEGSDFFGLFDDELCTVKMKFDVLAFAQVHLLRNCGRNPKSEAVAPFQNGLSGHNGLKRVNTTYSHSIYILKIWQADILGLTSVFVIPGDRVKNAEDRLVVMNRIARSAVEEARGMHPEFVVVRQEKDGRSIPIKKMYGTAWKNARERAADAWERALGTAAPQGFRRVRVHDLKHTFVRRLRAAGVSFEDRQDLLGHKSQRITTHYSEAELANLNATAEKACETKSRKTPAIFWATGMVSAQVEDN